MAERGTEIAVEVIGASAANKTTVIGGLTGAFGWLAQVNWIGLAGVIIALLGFLANLYFQHQRHKREELEREERRFREDREHEMRMQALRERCDL